MTRLVAALLLAVLPLAACDKATGVPGVEGIAIEPESPVVPLGETLQLTATVRGPDGAPLSGRAIHWSSATPSIAEIGQDGVVTPHAIGRVQIAASSEGQSAVVELEVVRRRVRTLSLSLASAELAVGDTTPLQVTALAGDGEAVDVAVRFSSTAPQVASVTEDGRIVGVAPGDASVVAAADDVADTTAVRVVPARAATVAIDPLELSLGVGQSVPVRVTVRDRAGHVLTDRTVRYTSSAPGIASVSEDGTVRALAPGEATVQATVDDVSGSATIRVAAPPVTRLALSPSAATVQIGGTVRFSAELRDASGKVVTGKPVQWSSSAPTVATVDAGGLMRAVAPGPTVISAQSEGISASAAVTVTLVPVATVAVLPADLALTVGDARQLGVTVRDAAGNALSGRVVTWSSSASSVATVSSSGEVRALSPGSATITATAEGKRGTATVTVAAPAPVPVATVTVAPTTARLLPDETTLLSVTLRDASGNVLTGRAVTWSSSAPDVATVATTGEVRAVAPGSATITATSEGKRGTATITVSTPPPVPVATVAVTPPTVSLLPNETRQLTATVRDAAGNELSGRVVTWSSSESSIAIVTSSGEVRAIAPGTATITATSEGKSGTATVTVSAPPPAPVATVAVAPATATLLPQEERRLSATLHDASGNVLSGRAVTWSSSAPDVATVTDDGLVRAVAPGSATITATSEGKSGSASITVSTPPPAPVATVTVAPADVSLLPGDRRQLTATLRDAAGNELTGRGVDWQTSAPSVASVSSTGEVEARGPGTATITATAEGKSGTATVTVGPPGDEPGAPSRMDKVSGDAQAGSRGSLLPNPLVARVVDARGRPVSGVSVLWSASHGGTISPALGVTDGNGQISVRWRLGNRNGTQMAEVRSLGLAVLTFTATGRD